jgi:hypothetical protein
MSSSKHCCWQLWTTGWEEYALPVEGEPPSESSLFVALHRPLFILPPLLSYWIILLKRMRLKDDPVGQPRYPVTLMEKT